MTSPSDYIVSRAEVVTVGEHDHVKVWNRGGLAGTLVVNKGDGAEIAARLHPDTPEYGYTVVTIKDGVRRWVPQDLSDE